MTHPDGYFITGTDTGVGKTEISLALMTLLEGQGYCVDAMKPVAAGCEWIDGEFRNDDAERLREQSSLDLAYKTVNPYALEPAVAPHIAASRAGIVFHSARIMSAFNKIESRSDIVVVEGVGGWNVPLNLGNKHSDRKSELQTTVDLASLFGFPVILVVGMRLGCLNHALLTAKAIADSGLPCAGWIANHIDPDMEFFAENCNTLIDLLPMPCLGVVPYSEPVHPEYLATFLNFSHHEAAAPA